MPFAREAEATLCNQTRLQNKGNVRVKLFETSSSKSRCLRSCCSLAYIMACDSLRTVALRRFSKGKRSTIISQICFQRARDGQVASNAKANVRSRLPLRFLPSRNRLATQFLNQENGRSIPKVVQTRPKLSKCHWISYIPET